MKQTLVVPGLALVLMICHAQAQTPPATTPAPPAEKGEHPPPPPPPHHGGPPSRGGSGDRDRGEWRGGMPGYGRPPMHSDGFDKLSEEDKKKVRAAFEKVWSRPEVIEARDRSMRANEELRATIRATLAKMDPEVVAILERIEPKDHFDPRELPKLPPPESPEFPRVVVQRLGMEMVAFSRPERREETRRLHERVIAKPQVREAIARLETTRGEERIQAMQKLREVYRESVGAEYRAYKERRAAEGRSGPPPAANDPSHPRPDAGDGKDAKDKPKE